MNRNPLSLGPIGTNGNDVTINNLNGNVTVTGAVTAGAGSAVSITTTGSGSIDGPGTVTSDDLALTAAGAIGSGATFQANAGGLLDLRAAGGDIAVANAATWNTSRLDLTAAGPRAVTLSGTGTAVVDSGLDAADTGLNADDRLVISGPTSILADIATGGIDLELLNVTGISAANINAGAGALSLQLGATVTPTVPGGTLTIGDTGTTRFEGSLAMGNNTLVTNGLVRILGMSSIQSNELTFNDFVRAGDAGASLLITTDDPPPGGVLELGGASPVFSAGNLAALGNARPSGFGGALANTTLSIMASDDQPSTLPGFSAPDTAANYDVAIRSPLNAGTADLTIVARGNITFETGGSVRGRQVKLNALGRQGDPSTGNITDRINPPATGAAPGTFAVQAIDLAVLVANRSIGSASPAEGGDFNADVPRLQALQPPPGTPALDLGGGIVDPSNDSAIALFSAFGPDLGGLGLYSTNLTGTDLDPVTPLSSRRDVSRLAVTDPLEYEPIRAYPRERGAPYAISHPAMMPPWDRDPTFPGDLQPLDPDDVAAWERFYATLRAYAEERHAPREDPSPEAVARSRARAEREAAEMAAYFERLRDRRRRP